MKTRKKVLVIGSGAREHMIVWKLLQDDPDIMVYCSPGNDGMRIGLPRVALLTITNIPDLIKFAQEYSIDFTIVGPEAPLVNGIVDAFSDAGLPIFGPNKAAAQLEGSKIFCKELLTENSIPTAPYRAFSNPIDALTYLESEPDPFLVVKADELAAGKGVIVAPTREKAMEAVRDLMVDRTLGKEVGHRILLEKKLEGSECSAMALVDGESIILFPSAQDFKREFDNDEGRNTGGMGSLAPVPACTDELLGKIYKILQLTVAALKKRGIRYRGVIYAGLMLTPEGPMVLEYNIRFGDPEILPILALLDVPLLPLLEATAKGTLNELEVRQLPKRPRHYAACLVLASPGYPDPDFPKELLIEGLEKVEARGIQVVYAGTEEKEDGRLYTKGGRVVDLVLTRPDLKQTDLDLEQLGQQLVEAADLVTFGGKPAKFRRRMFTQKTS